MITKELIAPRSIVVIGASNNTSKPGGKLLKNLIDNHFNGELWVVNPNESEVQGIPSFPAAEDLPQVDLAVLAIPAAACLSAVDKPTTGAMFARHWQERPRLDAADAARGEAELSKLKADNEPPIDITWDF